ncbi:MAG: insulinase family protein [Cyclobacteriaceae bacterium]|nr:insulinase family protein [Cyclobacteriaceae bacterium]
MNDSKKIFLSYFEKSYNERDKSQSRNYAQEYIRNFLDNEPIPGIEFEYHFANEHIPTIALEEINALSQKFFKEGNRVIVVNAPKKEDVILPTKDELLDVLSLVQQKHISPYIDDMAGQKLMEELPESGSIVSEEQIEQIDVTEITLNNGVKVILKPTDFKNDEIVMTAWSEGGSSLYDLDDYQSAANADAVVNECGVAGYSPSDLQKLLAGKTANARPYIGTLGEGLNGSCTPKDMETMFQLTHLYFTKPNKSKDLFEAYIDKSKALYKNLLSNPTYYFYNESAKVMSQNHPRGGQFPTEEDWDKINFDRTFEIYNERFQNAADFTFVIVGNFSLDSIKPYLARYLGSLPASDRQESWRDLGIRPPGGVVKKDFRKGADPKSSVSIRFHGEYQYDRKTNHQISSLTDLMDILLIEKIREEKGGVYGISARPSTSKDPFENYMISINFPCKPENSDTLTNAVFEVIHSIKHDGVDTAPVNKVKETQTREMEVKIKENGYWVSALKYSYEHGYDPIEIVNYQEKIDSLTPEILQKTALKYLNEKSYVYLRLLPQE